MLADDEASRRNDRSVLATALVDLGQSPAPAGAIGAGGDTVDRVERLMEHATGPTGLRRFVIVAVSLALIASPWVIAVVPAWAARSGLCPLPGS